MNRRKGYIPYLIAEILCLGAQLALFVLAFLSGSIIAITIAAVASGACAFIAAWVLFKLLSASGAKQGKKIEKASEAGGVCNG